MSVLAVLCMALPALARDRRPAPSKSGDWEVLYAGKAHQFRGYKLYDLPKKSWKVERGELKAIPGSPQIDLVSLSTYQDFELEVEWRLAPGADGGILYRVMEDEGPTWYSGLEYQLIDDATHVEAQEFNRTTGSLYDVAGARGTKTLKPAGQYNLTTIRVQGTQVQHLLNGGVVLSYDLASPQFLDLVQRSKFKNLPRFGREREGHICLQHMGNEVAFKSIRIRKLDGKDGLAPVTAN